MSNILTAIIKVLATGVKKTFEDVSESANKTATSISKITPVVNQFNNAIRLPNLKNGINGFKILGEAGQLAGSNLRSLSGVLATTATNIPVLSTGLKGLAASFLGGAGLSIAITAGIGLLSSFIRKLTETNDKIDENKNIITPVVTEYERFQASLESIIDSIGKEAGQFSILSQAVIDSTIPLQKRNDIVAEIQKKYPEYLTNLNKEKNLYQGIADSIGLGIRNLAIQAELKALMGAMGADFEKAVKAQVELNQLRRNQVPGGFFALDPEEFKQEEARLSGFVQGITNQLKAGKKSLEIVAGGGKSLIDLLFPDLKSKDQKEIKSKVDDWVAKFPALKAPIPLSFTIDFDKVKFVLLGGNIQTFKEQVDENINKEISKLVVKPRINLSLDVFKNQELLKKQREDLLELQKTAEFVGGTIANAFGQAFDQIARGENVFKALGNALKQVVLDLIKAAIQAAILSFIVNAITGGAGGVAKGAGIFKNIFRAKGGPVSAGGAYIVGEEGPELFRPNTGGTIIPNNQLGSGRGVSGGGMAVQVTGAFALRGQDLIAAITLANQSRNRLQ